MSIGRSRRLPRFARAVLWYFRRPLVGYFLLFVVSVIWSFVSWDSGAVGILLILLPWLFLPAVLLNLPLVGGAIRKLSLPLEVRRNHALEHGTIQVLRRSCVVAGVSGRADHDGFRISGAPGPKEIKSAFERFMGLPAEERRALAVAEQCGSMIVVTQGLGLILLLATVTGIAIWQPSRTVVGLLLAAQLALFLAGRRPLGRFLQSRRLLALDFPAARIKSITSIRSDDLFERSPTYFVRTVIETESRTPSGAAGQERSPLRSR